MSFAEFAASVAHEQAPPADVSGALKALWQDARGNWTVAHTRAQEDSSPDGAWVHAYLHRKEGDMENASYWYERAGRTRPADDVTLPAEWESIARALLGDAPKA
ncbi:MAG TPA: hypothetical protein VG710_02050 [Opitutus sp.]|nr:hypothetical protein [Opitutus sp.]